MTAVLRRMPKKEHNHTMQGHSISNWTIGCTRTVAWLATFRNPASALGRTSYVAFNQCPGALGRLTPKEKKNLSSLLTHFHSVESGIICSSPNPPSSRLVLPQWVQGMPHTGSVRDPARQLLRVIAYAWCVYHGQFP